MNGLDIVIALPLLWFTYKGFQQGIIMQVVFIVGLLFGLYGCLEFSDWVSEWLQTTELSDWTKYTAFIYLFTFVACFLLVRLLGKLVEKTVSVTGLSIVNKVVGAVLGCAKAILLLSGLLIAINSIDANRVFSKGKWVSESVLYKPISDICPLILPMIQKLSWTSSIKSIEDSVSSSEHSEND